MTEERSIKLELKEICADIRMWVITELCLLAINLAPRTPEGDALVASMAATVTTLAELYPVTFSARRRSRA
jgi:hypothetical protein